MTVNVQLLLNLSCVTCHIAEQGQKHLDLCASSRSVICFAAQMPSVYRDLCRHASAGFRTAPDSPQRPRSGTGAGTQRPLLPPAQHHTQLAGPRHATTVLVGDRHQHKPKLSSSSPVHRPTQTAQSGYERNFQQTYTG